ncbi:alpha/beta fold hydrolase, partial [uncultured Ruminobacter sp.]|uniref:alpha/beta fold hydrolase n=1 Tax=uncultured Ruminobacter sp. TaxID=538947 RepID=UPI0026146C92
MLQIVFLPGFLGSAHEFLTFADKIPVGAQILSLPGSGCSDAEVDFSSINDWMEEQLIGLKVKECILYGYSMGGRIAAHYALTAERRKNAVKGLILGRAGFGIADQQ